MSQPQRAPQPHYVLEIASAGRPRRRRVITSGRVVFGRSARRAHLTLADPHVSTEHGELLFDGGRVEVRDAGSANGVWFQGQRQQGSFELKPGQEFWAGAVQMKLCTVRGDNASDLVEPLPRRAPAPRPAPAPQAPRPQQKSAPRPHAKLAALPQPKPKVRRRHGVAKFLGLAAGLLGLVATFLPMFYVVAPPASVEVVAGTPALEAAAGLTGQQTAAGQVSGLLGGATETLVVNPAVEADSPFSMSLEVGGVDAGELALTALMVLPHVACGALFALALLGLFVRFGRVMGAATVVLAGAGAACWGMFLAVFAQVSFMVPAYGFWALALALWLGLVAGLVAVFFPER